jgi:acetyl-CoA acetyltransferase
MQFEQIYGLWGAPAYYAHAMNRYMHEFNISKKDFAQIAVVAREWATLNPTAVMHSKETHPFGGPIDIKTVLDSRPIAWPLNLLDCCLVTDHGGAVVITSKDRANDFKNTPVWIDGSGEAISHINMSQMQDMTETSAKESSKRAYAMAGLGPADMEMAMLYDSFTYTAGVTAEMVGLAPRGQGTDLWKNGAASPGGKFPINTNGGGLSYSHSGMYGILLLIEAQRQLAQKAIGLPGRQTNAKSAIINGTGGPLAATGTIIVSVDK